MMKTIRKNQNRGSALLLAVGLLTILAMLGTTFLLISRMNRQRTQAITAKATVDNLAAGIVSQVAAVLQDDFGVSGGDDVVRWRSFVNYASDDNGMDKFLWYYDGDSATRHYSNVIGDDGTLTKVDGGKTNNARLVSTTVMNSMGQRFNVAIRVLDTSSLINVNVACYNSVTPADMPSYGSPVGVDLREFIGEALYDRTSSPQGPNPARCGGQLSTPAAVNTNIALHPVPPEEGDPPNNYKPFAIGDEMYLRWLGSNNSRTETGRLFDSIESLENENFTEPDYLDGTPKRQFLTTHSVTRTRSRSALGKIDMTDTGFQNDLPAPPAGEKKEKDNKQKLYEDLLRAAYPLREDGEVEESIAFTSTATQAQKLKIAHFVANLWAYGSPSEQNMAFAVTPDQLFIYEPELSEDDTPELVTEGFTVYGVVAQPVIAEAYAYSLAQDYRDNGGAVQEMGDNGWAYAIELYNPTDENITLTYDIADQHGYRLVQGGNTFDFPTLSDNNPIVLAARTRVVIYSYGGQVFQRDSNGDIVKDGAGIPLREIATENSFGFTEQDLTPADYNGWFKWNELDFTKSDDVELWRIVKEKETEVANPQEVDILMDRVNRTDIDYTVDDKVTNGNTPTTVDDIKHDDQIARLGQRDDTHERAIITELYKPALTDSTFAEHTLSISNALPPGAVSTMDGVSKQGFSLKFNTENIADVANIYLYGPEDGSTDGLPQALDAVKNSLDRGRPDYLGAINVRPNVDPEDKYPSHIFPDVPWATLFNELFERIPDIAKDGRVYGRININTATKEVLKLLPWPDTVGSGTVDTDELVNYIIAYRDKKNIQGVPNYSNGRAGPTGIDNLRARPRDTEVTGDYGSNCRGFLTAGEIAIPLAVYAKNVGGLDESDANYLEDRDSLYRAVSNVISVSSDTFVVNFKIQMQGGSEHSWYYTAFIDRSNCTTADDFPAILLNNMSK